MIARRAGRRVTPDIRSQMLAWVGMESKMAVEEQRGGRRESWKLGPMLMWAEAAETGIWMAVTAAAALAV